MHIEQGKYGQTIIHDDGTGPEFKCLVADDEKRKSVLFGPLRTLFETNALFRISFLKSVMVGNGHSS